MLSTGGGYGGDGGYGGGRGGEFGGSGSWMEILDENFFILISSIYFAYTGCFI